MSIIDARIEKNIITGLIVSDDFCKRIAPILKCNPNYLKVPFARTVAKWCGDYYERYKKAPEKHIQDLYDKHSKQMDEDDRELTSEFLEHISDEYEKAKTFNPDYVIDDAINYFSKVSIENLQNKLSLNLEKSNIEKAEKSIADFKPLDFETDVDDIFKDGTTAKDLKHENMPEIKWIIEGIIPKGLTLLAGKAKVGKSFFLLNVAIDLSLGRKAFDTILTETSRVLYLGLEEPAQRTKTRIESIIKDGEWSEKLHIFGLGRWPKSEAGGFERLELWMQKHPDTQLIIIDTLAKFKSPKKDTNRTEYNEEYQSLEKLHTFAGNHNIGVIVAHHARKTKAEDIFDEIIGGMGIQASTDSLVVFNRINTNKDIRIYNYRGRDIGEAKKIFKFKDNGRFILSEDEITDYRKDTKQRNAIREYVEFYVGFHGKPIKRKELIKAMQGRVGEGIDVILNKMVDAGSIEKDGWGMYTIRGWAKIMQENERWEKADRKMNEIMDSNV